MKYYSHDLFFLQSLFGEPNCSNLAHIEVKIEKFQSIIVSRYDEKKPCLDDREK